MWFDTSSRLPGSKVLNYSSVIWGALQPLYQIESKINTMFPLIAFFASIVLIHILSVRMRIHPFLCLISSAFIYGIICGMDFHLIIVYITSGLGSIFSVLCIVIFSGVTIAEFLKITKNIETIVNDIFKTFRKKQSFIPILSGYLLSIPIMCCMTAFVVLNPVIEGLALKVNASKKKFLYMLAIGTVISFNLIYPSPVILVITDTLDIDPLDTLPVSIPISILLLVISYYFMHTKIEITPEKVQSSLRSSTEAWSPILIPISLIFLGLIVENQILKFLGDVNVALLIGVLISLIIANKHLSTDEISVALKRSSSKAGRILLDLCGAGALGNVIAHSDFSNDVFGLLDNSFIPVMLFPFLIAMFIQTAQGSRVVTAIVTADIVKDFACMQTVFMICAGTFMFSYVSDPYFWLVKHDSSMRENLKHYTLPLALSGVVVLVCAILFL